MRKKRRFFFHQIFLVFNRNRCNCFGFSITNFYIWGNRFARGTHYLINFGWRTHNPSSAVGCSYWNHLSTWLWASLVRQTKVPTLGNLTASCRVVMQTMATMCNSWKQHMKIFVVLWYISHWDFDQMRSTQMKNLRYLECSFDAQLEYLPTETNRPTALLKQNNS